MINKKWPDRILKIFMFMAIFALFSHFSTRFVQATELNEDETEDTSNENYGFIEDDREVEAYNPGISLLGADDFAADPLPASYDSRDYGLVTPVKNQGIYGNCWAFATLSSMESSLIKQGKADSTIDLSEYHLNYYSYFTGHDILGNTENDYVASHGNYMDLGGNYSFSLAALGNWKGFALENDYPLIQDRTKQSAIEGSMTDKAYQGNTYYLKKAYIVPMTEIDSVKRLVMDYGSAYTELRFVQGSSLYYNATTYAYYFYGSSVKNHAATIVGWDDNFSASNFSKSPSSDGAWIVKNSWGDTFGDNGYFYLSYEDSMLLTGKAGVFVGDIRDARLNNYYYDGGVVNSISEDVNGIGQKITIKANPGGNENLKSVGFVTNSAGIMYKVRVYVNPSADENGMLGNAQSADLEETGTTTYAGYYMHDFENVLTLKAGDVCAVFIDFYKEDDDGNPTTVSIRVDLAHHNRSGVYDSYNTILPGENYYGSYDSETGEYTYSDAYDFASTPRMNVITESILSTARVSSVSLNAGGMIGLNMYAEIPDGYLDTGAYAVINGDEYNKIPLVSTKDDTDEVTPLADGRVSREFTANVAAKEMKDMVTLQLFDAYGTKIPLENEGVFDDIFKYSVKNYIDSVNAKSGSPEKLKKLVSAMQNYNYAAREYFSYETDDIPSYTVNEYSANDFASYAREINGALPAGITYRGSSLILDGNIVLRHYFQADSGTDIGAIDFSLYNSEGKTGEKLANLTPAMKDGLYFVDINNISPSRLDEMYVLSVGDDFTLKCGPLSYIYSAKQKGNASLNKLMNALFEYSKAAKEYFTK